MSGAAVATGRLDSSFVKAAARQAGFHKVGVARAQPLDPGPLDRFLGDGFEADMAWLRRSRAKRLDPAALLPWARSVVALGLGYHAGDAPAPPPGTAQIARYARGRDYHAVMRRKLKDLEARLRARDPEIRAFSSADVAPVMEKPWAQRAGLGWIGKNGCLITADLGSWVLLATVILDRDLEPDAPHADRCGSCAACLPACPTGAIPEPGRVDARRCLAFHTIERRGPIPDEMAERAAGWGFGCDDCQTACPWNEGLAASAEADLLPREGQSAFDLPAMLSLTPEAYRRRFYGTALARARFDGLLRNALLAAGHSGEPRLLTAVQPHLHSELEGVRRAAAWAVAKLGKPRGRDERRGHGDDPGEGEDPGQDVDPLSAAGRGVTPHP